MMMEEERKTGNDGPSINSDTGAKAQDDEEEVVKADLDAEVTGHFAWKQVGLTNAILRHIVPSVLKAHVPVGQRQIHEA